MPQFCNGKITKASPSAQPDEFETSIGQTLLDLEMNSELKAQLRELSITGAKQIDVGDKKVCVCVCVCVIYLFFFPTQASPYPGSLLAISQKTIRFINPYAATGTYFTPAQKLNQSKFPLMVTCGKHHAWPVSVGWVGILEVCLDVTASEVVLLGHDRLNYK